MAWEDIEMHCGYVSAYICLQLWHHLRPVQSNYSAAGWTMWPVQQTAYGTNTAGTTTPANAGLKKKKLSRMFFRSDAKNIKLSVDELWVLGTTTWWLIKAE